MLNAIKLPIANIIPKKLKPVNGVSTDDVELGTGPKNRAGLASMETLDDSLKDNDGKDQTDKAVTAISNDNLETIKLNETNEEKEKEQKKTDDKEEEKKPVGCWDRIISYKCSVGNDNKFYLHFKLYLSYFIIHRRSRHFGRNSSIHLASCNHLPIHIQWSANLTFSATS